MSSNEGYDKTYDDYVERRDDPKRKLGKNLTNTQIAIFAIIGIALIYATFIKTPALLTKTQGGLLIALAIGVLYLIMLKDDDDFIDLREARAILRNEIVYMQKVTREIPSGTLKMSVPGSLKELEGKADCYYIAFTILSIDGLEIQYVGKVTFKGKVIGIIEEDSYFTAKDYLDGLKIKYIRTKEDIWADKYGRR